MLFPHPKCRVGLFVPKYPDRSIFIGREDFSGRVVRNLNPLLFTRLRQITAQRIHQMLICWNGHGTPSGTNGGLSNVFKPAAPAKEPGDPGFSLRAGRRSGLQVIEKRSGLGGENGGSVATV
jgi:hypothetical protein